MTIGAINTAAAGMLSAQKDADRAAGRIVADTARAIDPGMDSPERAASGRGQVQAPNPPLPPAEGSLIQDIVDLKTAKIAFEANAKVFKEADEMTGTLLDATE